MTNDTNKDAPRRKKLLNYLGRVCIALVSTTLVLGRSSALAVDATEAASQVIAAEGGKKALDTTLEVARSKPMLAVATAIVCLSCPPAGGVVSSPMMCVACGILVTKLFG
jgi:hypothetical protein